ncbi:MAG: sigma-70 family RNA polymerase sigma factor [Aquincola sp.]|nr:sigma-70 family RNA polymerase sigma factor [Aquincola sp.]
MRVDRGMSVREIAAEISVSRRRVEQLLNQARLLSQVGPFANLPSFHRKYLLTLGLTTLDDVDHALSCGQLQAPNVFGPSRIRDVELWLARERAQEGGYGPGRSDMAGRSGQPHCRRP